MHRKIWILVLIAVGLVAAATSVAVEFDPRHWFSNDSPPPAAAGRPAVPTASSPPACCPSPHHSAIAREVDPAVVSAKPGCFDAAHPPDQAAEAGTKPGQTAQILRPVTCDALVSAHLQGGLSIQALARAATRSHRMPGHVLLAGHGIALKLAEQLRSRLESTPDNLASLIARDGERLNVAPEPG